jgi:glycosyltransferase involved in cell wall biosynthesis
MTVTAEFALVIPAYNEAATIRAVVEAALQQIGRVIVVDDGSTDDTAGRLTGLPVSVLRHADNQGKAASLWDGMQAAVVLGVRGVITMDADGQHDAAEIPRLAAHALAQPDKLVIGSRLWNVAVIPKARYRANRFANFWLAWASGQAIEDSQSGFRVYPSDLIRQCHFKLKRHLSFVFESEIIIEAAQRGFCCLFVPVATLYPANARPSHFRPVLDIARITRMVAWRLVSRGLYLQGLWRSLTRRPLRAEYS